VPEYWIVDTDARTIERRRPDDSPVEILTESIEWTPDPDVPELVIDLPGYLDRVYGIGSTRYGTLPLDS
jgi:Uma2 family endonuclease